MKRIFEKLVDVKSEEICALGLAFVFDLGGSNYAPPLAGIRLVLNLWLGRKQAVLAENAKVHRL
jgi:hypothetical protein